MITIIIIAAAVLVAAVFAYAASKPDTFTVRRAALIAAPPEQIFPLIDDLHAQSAWSPFEKDPNMKRTYSGSPRGAGAVYAWDGNRQVGAGRLAITDSQAPSKVMLHLEMERPFKAKNVVEFLLERDGGGTSVSWIMRGPQPYMAKLLGLVMNCDKMVGGEFEAGLAKLKTLVETGGPAVAAE